MKRITHSSGTPLVSVLTPTIPERDRLLGECRQSVVVQHLDQAFNRDFEHLILIDHDHEGCAITMNRLAKAAEGTWLLPLADDDLLLPGAIWKLLEASRDDADGPIDVVYPRPLVWGESDVAFCREPPDIPSLALVRKSLWDSLGGYNEALTEREDNDLWLRAQGVARFVCYDKQPTWVYRLGHGGNKSRNGGVAS